MPNDVKAHLDVAGQVDICNKHFVPHVDISNSNAADDAEHVFAFADPSRNHISWPNDLAVILQSQALAWTKHEMNIKRLCIRPAFIYAVVLSDYH